MAARSDGQRLLHPAGQALAQPGGSSAETGHARNPDSGIALRRQNFFQIAVGGINGDIAQVEQGHVPPGIQMGPDGIGGRRVRGL